MKTLKLLLCLSLFIPIAIGISFSKCEGQSWLWGETGHGPIKLSDQATSVATDKTGNAYLTGYYQTSIVFNNDTLNNAPHDAAYLIKYNSSGSIIWAKQVIDNTGASYSTSVATDKSGNIYITGYFYGNAQAGTFSLTGVNNTNNNNIFIAKYNATGTVLWVKQSTLPAGNSYAYSNSVATDKYGNAFIAGEFKDTISFGSYTLSNSYTNNTNTFIVKYDSNGNVLWAKESTSITTLVNSTGTPCSIATDNSGNAYMAGYFNNTLTFGSATVNNPEPFYADLLVKYSPGGNVLWAKQSMNGSTNSYCNANSVTVDRSDNIYIAGSLRDTAKFGFQTVYSSSYSEAFLAKYDTNGNIIWVKPSSPGWLGTGLASDRLNHIYMTGMSQQSTFPDSIQFGSYKIYANPLAAHACFIEKLDTSGTPVCGSILSNLGSGGGTNSAASDSTGTYVYSGGQFETGTLFCGPDTLAALGGGPNTFVGRWQGCNREEGINEVKGETGKVKVYPNPFTNSTTISIIDNSQFTIYNLELDDITGRKLKQIEFTGNTYTLSAEGLAKGMYFIRIFDNENSLVGTKKIIIQ